MNKTIYIKGNQYGHLYTSKYCEAVKLTFKRDCDGQWDLYTLEPCFKSISGEKLDLHKEWMSENI